MSAQVTDFKIIAFFKYIVLSFSWPWVLSFNLFVLKLLASISIQIPPSSLK